MQERPASQIVAVKARLDLLDRVPEQWDPKSPWHDKRLRDAVNYALNRAAINEAACLGFCPPAGVIVPRVMDYALQVRAGALRSEEGQAAARRGRIPEGLRRRRIRRRSRGFPTVADAVVNDLNAAGIRVRMRQMERATFYANWQGEEIAGDLHGRRRQLRQRGEPGRDRSSIRRASYASGGYPDIDELYLAAGQRARPEKARGNAGQDPADDDRPRDVRAGHGSARADGDRAEA